MLTWLALVSAVGLPLLHPLVEKLQYRGYIKPELVAAYGSLQHMVFAVTPTGALAYTASLFMRTWSGLPE